MERVKGSESEYRRVKSDDFILSDEVVHEPIISDEMFEKAHASLDEYYQKRVARAEKEG